MCTKKQGPLRETPLGKYSIRLFTRVGSLPLWGKGWGWGLHELIRPHIAFAAKWNQTGGSEDPPARASWWRVFRPTTLYPTVATVEQSTRRIVE